jgi:Catalytic LigB subunit of aromatic ring-opening dioxygenase
MAELVLGVGSSHSPMVTMTGPDWLEWGQRDLRHPMLYTREGVHLTYDQRLAAVGDTLTALADPARCDSGADRVQAAVARLRSALSDARPDAVIVIGDDQDEQLTADNLPPFLVYWGDAIVNGSIENFDELPPLAQHYLPGYKETDGRRAYPVAVDLARHLIIAAQEADFDVAASQRLPDEDEGMGHAFAFPVRRLIEGEVPIVPVMVNTYNPPSQPRAARCAAFGAMVRQAIDSFPGSARVAVIASGGLSHFLVLEDLDREVLAALERRDLAALTAIPEPTFTAGTSEIKNWIVAAGACHDRRFELVDYVPGYRTPAGSGTGLAFGLWR